MPQQLVANVSGQREFFLPQFITSSIEVTNTFVPDSLRRSRLSFSSGPARRLQKRSFWNSAKRK